MLNQRVFKKDTLILSLDRSPSSALTSFLLPVEQTAALPTLALLATLLAMLLAALLAALLTPLLAALLASLIAALLASLLALLLASLLALLLAALFAPLPQANTGATTRQHSYLWLFTKSIGWTMALSLAYVRAF
jgi:hypothetical protein